MTQNILERETYTSPGYRHHNALSLVETIKKYILAHDCPSMSMDISHLNIIDASKVTILCSTYHYAKYPHGRVTWKINSSEVHNIIKPLNLGNIRLVTV